ncbi:MAG TPA: diacylglycerol kinase family protein [Blastocatellia bacterium]|nr:diacylglycerol kinase family protein [Blastocatellia bacterium]
MSFKRAFIIYNPTSGRPRDRAQQVLCFQHYLEKHGVDSVAEATTRPNEASRLARVISSNKQFDLIVINGGDGTINEVLQGMAGSSVPMAIWPGGTANVLAQDLGIPIKGEEVANLIARGKTKQVTVGRAGDRYFFLMAGIGLDASIVNRVNRAVKRRLGIAAYWFAGIGQLIKWRPELFTLEVAGAKYPATFATIGNTSGYGGGLKMTPLARMDEHCLDVCIFSTKSRWRYIRYLLSCYSGKQTPDMSGVVYLKAKEVHAICATSALVQVDGELVGSLPMRFEAVPDAVTLVVP